MKAEGQLSVIYKVDTASLSKFIPLAGGFSNA